MKPLGTVVGLVTAVLVFLLAGTFPPVWEVATLKTVVVAAVSAYLIGRGISAALVLHEQRKVWIPPKDASAEFVQPEDEIEFLVEAEKWISLSPSIETIDFALRRRENALLNRVHKERAFGNAAVYIGLGGTLIGLTIAVVGLKGLGSDPELLKDQILSVVSGFGAAFIAALAGVFANLLVGSGIARYEHVVSDRIVELERRLVEETLGSRNPGQEIAKRVAEGVKRGMSASLAELPEALSRGMREGMATTVSNLTTVISEQRVAIEYAGRVSSASAKAAGDAAIKLTDAVAKLDLATTAMTTATNKTSEATEKSNEVVRTLTTTGQNFATDLGRIRKALDVLAETSTKLSDAGQTAKDAGKQMEAFVAGGKGVVDGLKDALDGHEKRVAEAIAKGASRQADGVIVLLQQVQKTLENITLCVHNMDEAVRELPLSVPAARLVQELQLGRKTMEQIAGEDAARVTAAAARLAEAERDVHSIVVQLEAAYASVKEELEEIRKSTETTQERLTSVSETLDLPIWKRWWGRD